jgi:hypothetical protein
MVENTTDNISSNDQQTNEFAEEFNKLIDKYHINDYVCIIQHDDKMLALCDQNNLLNNTKLLKQAHFNFHSEVLNRIGESQ